MFTIHLHKLDFFAHHGLHDEEGITGTNFEVDVDVVFNPVAKITSITQTIDYTKVYDVVQRHMKQPVALLEMLAENISVEIADLDPRISQVTITITKLHPPISSFSGHVGITYVKVIK